MIAKALSHEPTFCFWTSRRRLSTWSCGDMWAPGARPRDAGFGTNPPHGHYIDERGMADRIGIITKGS